MKVWLSAFEFRLFETKAEMAKLVMKLFDFHRVFAVWHSGLNELQKFKILNFYLVTPTQNSFKNLLNFFKWEKAILNLKQRI